VRTQEQEHEISVSIGMAYRTFACLEGRVAESAAAVLADADAAMYRAKDQGKDRIEVVDEGVSTAAGTVPAA
jgi:GGDEF domain-containing protein